MSEIMHGKNRIGYELAGSGNTTITSYSLIGDAVLDGNFHTADDREINAALEKATRAFRVYSTFSGEQKATFLEAIGEELLALGDTLIQRVMAETALPEARVTGERGRTIGQLNLFASLLREGSWVEATIDTALPDRKPLPRPDIRKMLVPTGPVVVFPASNFPLAFSTAGGDTASALAAGNPVIIKAHESHLGTNELVSEAIAKAAERTGMPDGVFSSLNGSGYELGQKLVMHPLTKSVAFTGSYRGGMALHDLANKRREPIPVFAEMGSINPVFLLPGKLGEDSSGLAKAYAASVSMGVGQFCTNPGLLVGIRSAALDKFIAGFTAEMAAIAPSTMLNANIARGYRESLKSILEQQGVKLLYQHDGSSNENEGPAAIGSVPAAEFIKNPELAHEVFGPFSLLVECENDEELAALLEVLPGQLTTTFMASDQDIAHYEKLIGKATGICGRLIFNGVPTGVEVCHSMQHGGPFPASTDGRFTSVGTGAILRFVRPVSFQDAPQQLLPDALKDSNPLGIWRKVNGEHTQKSI